MRHAAVLAWACFVAAGLGIGCVYPTRVVVRLGEDAAPADAPPVDAGACTPREARSCYDGPSDTVDRGACHAGTQRCGDDGGWGACEGAITPRGEVCNAIDDDCDGATDEEVVVSCGVGACTRWVMGCTNGHDPVCNPGPTSLETCNGVDDDCNGAIDDGGAAASCFADHAFGACRTGSCVVGSCADGYGDCDGRFDNGCEAIVVADAIHCGACGQICGSGEFCRAGRCDRVVDVAIGSNHACAALSSGTALCWGDNRYGQLGDGSFVAHTDPRPVVALTDVTDLAAGDGFTCARLASGRFACWGVNSAMQLGDGTTTNRNVPTVSTSLVDAAAVACGATHACVLRASGDVVCWGRNNYGPLGDGTNMNRSTPTPVAMLSDVAAITAGDQHTCALRHDGACTAGDRITAVRSATARRTGGSYRPVCSRWGVRRHSPPATDTRARCSPMASRGAGATTPMDNSATGRGSRTRFRWSH